MLSCTEEGMCVGVGGFMFWQILPSIFDFWKVVTYIYIYRVIIKVKKIFFLKTFRRKSSICIYIYIYNKFITSWTSMFNETVWEILLPSLGLIKHDVINLLYYEHWTDKQIYIYIYIYTIYICDTKSAQILQK